MYTLSFSKPHTMKCQWVIRAHSIIQQTSHYVVSMGDSCTPYYSANPTLWSVNGWFMYTLLFSKPHTKKSKEFRSGDLSVQMTVLPLLIALRSKCYFTHKILRFCLLTRSDVLLWRKSIVIHLFWMVLHLSVERWTRKSKLNLLARCRSLGGLCPRRWKIIAWDMPILQNYSSSLESIIF